MATSTVIADTPEYTLTRVVDPATGATDTDIVFKAGSPGFNQAAMISKMVAALSALESADTNWGTLSSTQKIEASRNAIRCVAKLVRFALGQFDAN